MLLSYLKIAWKVLLRRKLFTFISLFGISFTLMVLLVVVAFLDHAVGSHAPESRLDRTLFVNFVHLKYKDGGNSNTLPSYYFLNKYVRTMRTPENVTICSMFNSSPTYVGNRKVNLDLKYTDGAFWDVLEFSFLEGKPYTKDDVDRAARVAVINESTARNYFGQARGVVGRTIQIDQRNYRVAGVVADVSVSRFNSYSDVWVPLTTGTFNLQQVDLSGMFLAIVLAKSPAETEAVQAEFAQIVKRVPLPDPKSMEELTAYADPLMASYTRQLMGFASPGDNGMVLFSTILGVLALLFMSLPALNLVNINVTRIMERSSEIGVRKAFGATGTALIGQFLVENIFLTFIGGLLGLGLAYVALQLLSNSDLIAYAQFELNLSVFAWALLLTLVFGVLSGVYPALKMSRLQPVQALKGNSK
ncbi:ABC transporter permease [Hymenobacter koreensis]|uniref:ABC transporter permease n=1 Tax=Hymenobacter koreensis TaxID=1084523 RepID=A0ABP8JMA8_9BACT